MRVPPRPYGLRGPHGRPRSPSAGAADQTGVTAPVSDRLNALDVSFLYLEEPTTPMHVGGVAVFTLPDTGFDYDRLVRLIRRRIAFVPRYRQRIRWIPRHNAAPGV